MEIVVEVCGYSPLPLPANGRACIQPASRGIDHIRLNAKLLLGMYFSAVKFCSPRDQFVFFLPRLDVWNLIPGEGSAEVVKAMVKEKIQVWYGVVLCCTPILRIG